MFRISLKAQIIIKIISFVLHTIFNGIFVYKGIKQNSEDLNIEREARERVAVMLHRSRGASTEYDCSQASIATDSVDGNFNLISFFLQLM